MRTVGEGAHPRSGHRAGKPRAGRVGDAARGAASRRAGGRVQRRSRPPTGGDVDARELAATRIRKKHEEHGPQRDAIGAAADALDRAPDGAPALDLDQARRGQGAPGDLHRAPGRRLEGRGRARPAGAEAARPG